MATVAEITTFRNPVQHDATYRDVEGVATLRPGGWTFEPDGGHDAWLVCYKDSALVLLGRCDLADTQRQADEQAGSLAALVCGYGRTV
jgi:hypothetical protein